MAGANHPRCCHLPTLLAIISAAALLLFFPRFSTTAAAAVDKGTNRSSLLGEPREWATGKDEAEILAEAEARAAAGGEGLLARDDGREFHSLDGMLQWAIGMGLLRVPSSCVHFVVSCVNSPIRTRNVSTYIVSSRGKLTPKPLLMQGTLTRIS